MTPMNMCMEGDDDQLVATIMAMCGRKNVKGIEMYRQLVLEDRDRWANCFFSSSSSGGKRSSAEVFVGRVVR